MISPLSELHRILGESISDAAIIEMIETECVNAKNSGNGALTITIDTHRAVREQFLIWMDNHVQKNTP